MSDRTVHSPEQFLEEVRRTLPHYSYATLNLLEGASEENLAAIPAEVACEIWRTHAHQYNASTAVERLGRLPAIFRRHLPIEEMVQRWRFWAAENSHEALTSLLNMGPEMAAHFSENDAAWAWRAAVKGGYNEHAMRQLAELPERLRAGIPVEDIRFAWHGMAKRRLKVALQWLTLTTEELRAHIRTEEITALWRAEVEGERTPLPALQALEGLPAWMHPAFPTDEVAEAARALEQGKPGSLSGTIGLLPAPLRREIDPEEVRDSWQALAERSEESALSQVVRMPEETRGWMNAGMVGHLWRRLAAREPLVALRVYADLPAPLRVEILPDQLGETFQRESARERATLSRIKDLPEETRQALSPTFVGHAWRHRAEKDPWGALWDLGHIPESLLRDIQPREVATLWRSHLPDHRNGCLRALERIPERLRAELTAGEVAEAWKSLRSEDPRVAAQEVWPVIPAPLRQELPEEAREEAWFRYGAQSTEGAVRATANLIEEKKAEAPPLLLVWEGYAETLPYPALDWLRKQSAPIRDLIPVERVHAVWKRALEDSPLEALAWLERVPQKLRPPVGREEVALLLGHPDAQVRLKGITLAGQEANPSPAARGGRRR